MFMSIDVFIRVWCGDSFWVIMGNSSVLMIIVMR